MNKTAPAPPKIKKVDALALFDNNVSAMARWFQCSRAAYYEWTEYLPAKQAYQIQAAFPDIQEG